MTELKNISADTNSNPTTSFMTITTIKTRTLTPPHDDLITVIKESLPKLEERTILAVTSKVVSIWQGRCIKKSEYPNKDSLIIKEADHYLPREFTPHGWILHTIKDNILIPTAGIDESNGNDYYILWPKDPEKTAQELRAWLCKEYDLSECGIIITDSHTIPFRRGTMGISLASAGFAPIKDYRANQDLFGRPYAITVSNIVDALGAAAVVAMGEGRESTPLTTITDTPFVTFFARGVEADPSLPSLTIEKEEDLYAPFLSSVPWMEGGRGK